MTRTLRPVASSAPLASIIVHACNADRTLGRTLAALRAQSFRNFEVIVVDDGSIDATSAIVRCAAERDRRVRLLRMEGADAVRAWAAGSAAARGEFIGFCEAGDSWLPGKLAAHVAQFTSDARIGLSHSGARLVSPDGLEREERARRAPTIARLLGRVPMLPVSSLVVRRAAIETLVDQAPKRPLIDTSLGGMAGLDFVLRLAVRTDWSIVGLPEVHVRCRYPADRRGADRRAQYLAFETTLSGLRTHAPVVCARHEGVARARRMRALARQALRAGEGREALGWLSSSIHHSARPHLTEPVQSLALWGLAALQALGGPLTRSMDALTGPDGPEGGPDMVPGHPLHWRS